MVDDKQQKYRLSEEVRELLTEAEREPYKSINARRGTSIGYFEHLIEKVDPFLQRFEQEVGLNGTSTWKGLRLHECAPYIPPEQVKHTQLRTLLAAHMKGIFYATLDQEQNAAVIPLENYGHWLENGNLHYSTYTMPHFTIIRPLHIDAKKHLISLGIPELEGKARKILEEMVAQAPEFKGDPTNGILNYLQQAYIAFAETLHSLASTCFEIEAYRNDPALMGAFNAAIELPPAQIVVDTWKEAGAPFGYKLNEDGSGDGRQSFVEEHRQYIDLDQLHAECLKSARDYVGSMELIKKVYESLSNLEMDDFRTALMEFMETQKPAGILSPLAFIQEHVRKRENR